MLTAWLGFCAISTGVTLRIRSWGSWEGDAPHEYVWTQVYHVLPGDVFGTTLGMPLIEGVLGTPLFSCVKRTAHGLVLGYASHLHRRGSSGRERRPRQIDLASGPAVFTERTPEGVLHTIEVSLGGYFW